MSRKSRYQSMPVTREQKELAEIGRAIMSAQESANCREGEGREDVALPLLGVGV